jgi:hypothetical protein
MLLRIEKFINKIEEEIFKVLMETPGIFPIKEMIEAF